MPPQQSDRLLDLFDQGFDFRAHGFRLLQLSESRAGCNDYAAPMQPLEFSLSDETRNRLLGTWKLISAQIHDLDSGSKTDIMGPQSRGFLNYSPDGRISVIVVGGPERKPAGPAPTPQEKQALFDSLNSYGGTYSTGPNEVTHHVDISWNELWTGTNLKRSVTFEGNRMQLANPPSRDANGRMHTREMTWEKLA
jgi:hypothetical protein